MKQTPRNEDHDTKQSITSGQRFSSSLKDGDIEHTSQIDLMKNNFLYIEFFKKYLSQIKGNKILVLSSSMIGKIKFLIPNSVVKKVGITSSVLWIDSCSIKIFKTKTKNFVFFIEDGITTSLQRVCVLILSYYNRIKDRIGDSMQLSDLKDFYIFLVPNAKNGTKKHIKNILSDAIKMGMNIHILSLPIDLFGFEKDTITIENSTLLYSAMIENDFSNLSSLSSSIIKFQLLNGIIPSIKGVGRFSCMVGNMVVQETCNKLIFNKKVKMPIVNEIIFFDRNIDLMSVFLSQLSYEGLLDEIFGIDYSYFTYYKGGNKSGKSETLLLNSKYDSVYEKIRNFNQNFVAGEIKNITNEIKVEQDEVNQFQGRNEMENLKSRFLFAKTKLPKIKLKQKKLEIHLDLMQQIKTNIKTSYFRKCVEIGQMIVQKQKGDHKYIFDFVTEIIFSKKHISEVLRILSLFCFVNNGLQTKDYNKFKDAILMTYGFDWSLSLRNLENARILYHKGSFSSSQKNSSVKLSSFFNGDLWNEMCDHFNLISENTSTLGKFDDHHTFAGIAPLSVRLFKNLLFSDDFFLKNNSSLKKHIKSKSKSKSLKFKKYKEEERWEVLYKDFPKFKHVYNELKDVFFKIKRKKVIMLFMIGGITHAECNAIRHFNKTSKMFHVVIGTTKLINAKSFLNQFYHELNRD